MSVLTDATYKLHVTAVGPVRAEQCELSWWLATLRDDDRFDRDRCRILAARALEAFEAGRGRRASAATPTSSRAAAPVAADEPEDEPDPDDDDEPEPHDPDAEPGMCFCHDCLEKRARARRGRGGRRGAAPVRAPAATVPVMQSKTYARAGDAMTMTIEAPDLSGPAAIVHENLFQTEGRRR